MLEKFIRNRMCNALPFSPNEGQEELLTRLAHFVVTQDNDTRYAFILRGYAGTGKTSVVAALVKTMCQLQQSVVLLAPTGRAAKVLSHYAEHPAYTIHKYIYRQKQLGIEDFTIAENLHKGTLFIIDEASMISGQREASAFGTGLLLDDVVSFVYSGTGCKILLSGDDAQLPPVGSTVSPALDERYMAGYGLDVTSYTLTQVVRQALDSGILRNATDLRNQLSKPSFTCDVIDNFLYGNDFQCISPCEILEALEQSYHDVGEEETIILTRTNRRTNLYNSGVRSRILWREDMITTGDRVMVSKNNYFWSANYDNLPFIANGDMFQITRLRNMRELYGFTFADASLQSLDYSWEIDAVIWVDTLSTDSPDANYQLQQTLFERIAEDYPELHHSKRKLIEAIYQSPYFNALQIRFSYAVTCHKSQGGQWKRVFIDTGNATSQENDPNYYRWLYTAITRATERVYLLKNT